MSAEDTSDIPLSQRQTNTGQQQSAPGCVFLPLAMSGLLPPGDFCPWNMIEYKGELKLIDWELAADRALGHDIFTYIVQTSSLLYPNKSLKKAINEYEDMIKEYFYLLGVENYQPYLHEFIRERIAYERSKGNHNRVLKLSEVIDYE